MKNHSPKKRSNFLSTLKLNMQRIFISCFFVTFFFTQNEVIAQEPRPFECNNVFYHMVNGNLHALNVADNTFELLNAGGDGYLNAMGFNMSDNLIYGIWHPGNNIASNVLMRIDADGNWSNLGEISGLPIEKWNSGDFDDVGNLYIYKSTIQSFYKINVTDQTAVPILLNEYPTIADLCFNPLDGLFYGVTHLGDLATIDPQNATVTINHISGAVAEIDGGYGATWITGEEILYVYRNYGGEIYRIEGVGTIGPFVSHLQLATDEISNRNDGANCASGGDPFDDDDCDDVPDSDDLCNGGDDNIDNNGDGIPDCASFPGIEYVEESWLCGNGNGTFKIQICHVPPGNPQNAHTLCLPLPAIAAHSDHHDDYLGPCNVVTCLDDLQGSQNQNNRRPRNNASTILKATAANIAMFPNPAQDLVRLRLHSVTSQASEIMIYNKLGQILYQNNTTAPELIISLHDRHFTTGVYMVKINTNNQIITKRLAITK